MVNGVKLFVDNKWISHVIFRVDSSEIRGWSFIPLFNDLLLLLQLLFAHQNCVLRFKRSLSRCCFIWSWKLEEKIRLNAIKCSVGVTRIIQVNSIYDIIIQNFWRFMAWTRNEQTKQWILYTEIGRGWGMAYMYLNNRWTLWNWRNNGKNTANKMEWK